MHPTRLPVIALSLASALSSTAFAAEFDAYGAAPPNLVAIQPTSDFVFVLGAGIGMAPVYEGASNYGPTFNPIIKVERLYIPGLLDIGGADKGPGGFAFAPSVSIAGKRISADHDTLIGLKDVDTTYALGVRVGYQFVLVDSVSAEVYGAGRYAFGGAQGLIGEVGVDVTAQLTPQLEIVGGPVVAFATENYMDTYFGVTGAESTATGGRLADYDPSGGIKSVGVKLAARYEVIPDTFINLDGSYTALVGDAAASPIVAAGSQHQFTIGLGLSRRFSF